MHVHRKENDNGSSTRGGNFMSFDFSKLTKTQITKMIRNTAPIANAKLKEMRSKGYDKFNYSMIRK